MDFDVAAATDICVKEGVNGSLRRVLLRKVIKTLKALVLAIIAVNLVRKDLSFYYDAIFIGPFTIQAIFSSFHR